MARSSNPPAQTPPTAPKHLRPELEVLVRALAALPEPERSEVYAAVNEEARRTREPTLSWDEWEAARGVVSLGGNAVEDGDAHMVLERVDEPDLTSAASIEAWRQWVASGQQGPIEDEGEPEFP